MCGAHVHSEHLPATDVEYSTTETVNSLILQLIEPAIDAVAANELLVRALFGNAALM